MLFSLASKRLNSTTFKHDNKQQLIQTILNCTASRREARSYLAKYALLESNNIYNQTRDIDDLNNNKTYGDYISKVIPNEITDEKYLNKNDLNEIKLTESIRTCIIKIDFDEIMNWDYTLIEKFGTVLMSVLDLGASPILIIGINKDQDPIMINDSIKADINNLKLRMFKHLQKFVNLRILDSSFEIHEDSVTCPLPSMIGVPLFSGIVPIVLPTAVDTFDLKTKIINTNKVTTSVVQCIKELNESNKSKDDIMTVEKIVFVDKIGGIPSMERGKSSCHVLINLQQEFHSVIDELSPISSNQSNKGKINWIDDEVKIDKLKSFKEMANLLKLLPNSTGIMTTPNDLTKISSSESDNEPNPLIYSILTDRATQSSSLPVGFGRTQEVNTTILKWGTPVHIITSKSLISLGLNSCVKNQYCVDLQKLDEMNIISCSKLKNLIEDSFRKEFDWDHYMNRIKDSVAAIIFTNDYSAGCIVTYEIDQRLEIESEIDNSDHWIPYLDKFAVVRAQQGEPGLADIIFKALLSQFPEELVWRSRKTNPVNKWYFERSVGTIGIDDSPWRVFYTGWKNEVWDSKRIDNYIEICRDIEPSFIS